jgi:putative membrane-bound dehydrogenase-like protein
VRENFKIQNSKFRETARIKTSIIRWLLLPIVVIAVVFLGLSAVAVDGPLSPADSLAYLKTEPGLKVELVVAEPMVVSPVALAWDARGRMFVVEDRGYPIGPGKGKPPAGQVVLLEDTNGDGQYDKRTIFADKLTFPNGVMAWSNGVYVTCAPFLYYFKDTDSDGAADIRETVFKGFQDLSTTQLRVSHPVLNLDNWVYLTSGLTAAKVTSPAHPDRPAVFLNRVDGRFRPGTDEIEETSGTAQFGESFDVYGRKFICSNRNHIQQVVMQTAYLKRNPNLAFGVQVEDIPDHGAASRVYPLSANITTAAFHAGYFTSACAITVYNGTALPENYRGNSFTCEPAGNLVHHDVLTAESNSVTFIARRAYPTNEFLASPDNWFRPVNLAIGPDGALYVCDMYRKTIEHPDYLPEATRKVTDFESGKTMGRIYRISAQDFEPRGQRRFDLSAATTPELCRELENPNQWWAMTAHRLLLERRDAKAFPLLRRLAARGKSPESRVQALRVLEGTEGLEDAQILAAMGDSAAGVREHAIQLAEPRLEKSPRLGTQLLNLAGDSDARVRFQCALSLGQWSSDRIVPALATVAVANLEDKWTRAAVLSSIYHREQVFFDHFMTVADKASNAGMPPFMRELSHVLAAALPSEKLQKVMEKTLAKQAESNLPWQMAAISGFGTGLRSRAATEGQFTMASLTAQAEPALRVQLKNLYAKSGEIAVNEKQSVDSRLAAISLLGHAEFAVAGPPLEKLIAPRQPSEVQTAAIKAIGQINDPAGGPALVTRERWNAYSPAVRDIALTVLTGNPGFIRSLFDAIEKGDVPAWTVNGDRRTQLMRHKDTDIQARATALFKNVGESDRMKVYEEYKTVLSLKPDSKNGHAMFQKNCTACHVFAGEGHIVGPDLTGIRNQPSEVLLLHIIVPEYEIVPIYTCYNIETKEGQGFTGLLAAETPTAITVRMAQGLEQQIPRADIATMTTSRLSLMPDELEKAMSRQDMADLIAFLKGE